MLISIVHKQLVCESMHDLKLGHCCREMEASGIHRDEYVYHHLLEAFRLGNQPDLMMQCTDWLRADNIPCGPHLYIVSNLVSHATHC